MAELVNVFNLKKYFELRKGLFKSVSSQVRAVDDISFSIGKGETLGLVGESGSGKSTVARLIMKLITPTSGSILFENTDVVNATHRMEKNLRKQMGIVFQDPSVSMNPRATILWSLRRPLLANGTARYLADSKIKQVLKKVNLGRECLERYPHQLSGGQLQRVSVARALLLQPQLLVLDEPTSALDISVQAQVLNVLLDLQQEFGLSYLFITHDLNVVRYISDRVAIMYLGKLMEIGPVDLVMKHPLHPYTRGLDSSSPPLSPHQRGRGRLLLSETPPSLIELSPGCRLSPRCPFSTEACQQVVPELRQMEAGHWVACHKAGNI